MGVCTGTSCDPIAGCPDAYAYGWNGCSISETGSHYAAIGDAFTNCGWMKSESQATEVGTGSNGNATYDLAPTIPSPTAGASLIKWFDFDWRDGDVGAILETDIDLTDGSSAALGFVQLQLPLQTAKGAYSGSPSSNFGEGACSIFRNSGNYYLAESGLSQDHSLGTGGTYNFRLEMEVIDSFCEFGQTDEFDTYLNTGLTTIEEASCWSKHLWERRVYVDDVLLIQDTLTRSFLGKVNQGRAVIQMQSNGTEQIIVSSTSLIAV